MVSTIINLPAAFCEFGLKVKVEQVRLSLSQSVLLTPQYQYEYDTTSFNNTGGTGMVHMNVQELRQPSDRLTLLAITFFKCEVFHIFFASGLS